jgi:hypothetical protein
MTYMDVDNSEVSRISASQEQAQILHGVQRLSGFVKTGWWKSRKTVVLFPRFPTTSAAATG